MEQIEVVKGEGFLVVKAERNGDKVSFILISYKGDVVLTDAQVLALLVQTDAWQRPQMTSSSMWSIHEAGRRPGH